MSTADAPSPGMHRPSVRWILLGGATFLACAAAAWSATSSRPSSFEILATSGSIAAYSTVTLLWGIAAATLAFEPPRTTRAAPATALMALSWASTAALISAAAPPALRLAAAVLAAIAPAALLQLAGAVGAGPLPRGTTSVCFGLLAAVAALRSVVTDPFRDPDCRTGCDAPAFVLVPSPAASLVLGGALSAASAIVAATACALAIRGVATRRTGRRRSRALLVLIALAAVAAVAARTLPTARAVLGPLPPIGDGLLVVQSLLGAALALGLIARFGRRAQRAASLRHALDEAAHEGAPPELERVLARAVHDPGLRLSFWLPTMGEWADAAGARVRGEEHSRGDVTIRRHDAVVARVRTGRQDLDPAELLSVIGSAALLLLDNERLRVERRAQAEALRRSLQRIVDASDSERRRIERELHDGAQQRLLAAIFAYRLAVDPEGAPDPEAEAELRTVTSVLDALREAARGIYPPVLADAGLVPALESLARTSRARVSITAPALPRVEASVELTLYAAVREALARTADESVSIVVRRSAGALAVEMRPANARHVERIGDRVGALGGSIRSAAGSVTVELPCA